jgi:hypothetical protein
MILAQTPSLPADKELWQRATVAEAVRDAAPLVILRYSEGSA